MRPAIPLSFMSVGFWECPKRLQRYILLARVGCLDKVPKLFYSLTSLDLLDGDMYLLTSRISALSCSLMLERLLACAGACAFHP